MQQPTRKWVSVAARGEWRGLWASLLPVTVLDGSHVNDLVNANHDNNNNKHKNVSIQDKGASVNRTSQHKLQQRDHHPHTHTCTIGFKSVAPLKMALMACGVSDAILAFVTLEHTPAFYTAVVPLF